MPGHMKANIRVTANQKQGGRLYMEDVTHIHFEESEDGIILWSFFAVYDGHGGAHASNYAKKHLMKNIVSRPNFWTTDDKLILQAIKEGFAQCHKEMWSEINKWPMTKSGYTSTAGTTASVMFIKHDKAYIGHVGDSGIVLGMQESPDERMTAKQLTTDHKPQDPVERLRIHKAGGNVLQKNGVDRVVWRRQKKTHKGVVRRSTELDSIPFLAIARSLGDFWSYDHETKEYCVSPEPDLHVVEIDWNKHKCIILGSDGLWNVVKPHRAVNIVEKVEEHCYNKVVKQEDVSITYWVNPSQELVNHAIEMWGNYGMRADNTSAITILIDPPQKPRKEFLIEERERYRTLQLEDQTEKLKRIHVPPSAVPIKYRRYSDSRPISKQQPMFRPTPYEMFKNLNNGRVLTPTKYRVSNSAFGVHADENITGSRYFHSSSVSKEFNVNSSGKTYMSSTSNCLRERNEMCTRVGQQRRYSLESSDIKAKLAESDDFRDVVNAIVDDIHNDIQMDRYIRQEELQKKMEDERNKTSPDIEGKTRKRRSSGGYVEVSEEINLDDSDFDKQAHMLKEGKKIMQRKTLERKSLELTKPPTMMLTRKRARTQSLEANPVKRLRSGREVTLTPTNIEKNKTISRSIRNRINNSLSKQFLNRSIPVQAAA